MDSIIRTEAIISARDDTGAVLSGVERKFEEVGRALGHIGKGAAAATKVDELNAALHRTQGALASAAKVREADVRVSAMGVRFRETAQAVRDAEIAMKAADKAAAASLAREYSRAEAAAKRAGDAYGRAKDLRRAAVSEAADAGIDIGHLASEEGRLATKISDANTALENQKKLLERGAEDEKRAARQELERKRAEERQAHEVHHLGAKHELAAAAAGYVGGQGVIEAASETAQAGARYQHETVALANAGRTPAELAQIERVARETAVAVPTSTYTENLKTINETTGAFGHLSHALENVAFIQKAASVLHSAAGDKIQEGAADLGNKLVRFFELRGTAGNTPLFQHEAAELMRSMVFTRGVFNPEQALDFAQQAKSSLQSYGLHFLTRIVPSIVTELGGERAGTAANAFENVIMGKARDKKQVQGWLKLGLLNRHMLSSGGRGGAPVSWTAGAIKDTDLALRDPLAWAEQVLIPAMKAHGIDTNNKIAVQKELGTLARNQNANMFFNIITQALSRARLHKDDPNIGQTQSVQQDYRNNLNSDPTVGWGALKAGLDDLMTAASAPAMGTTAKVMSEVAGGLQSLAAAAAKHPDLALTGGIATLGAAAAGSGYLAYKALNGFGLGTAATALDGSAAALTEAAAELGGRGAANAAVPVAKTGAEAAAAPATAGFAARVAGVAEKFGMAIEAGVAGAIVHEMDTAPKGTYPGVDRLHEMAHRFDHPAPPPPKTSVTRYGAPNPMYRQVPGETVHYISGLGSPHSAANLGADLGAPIREALAHLKAVVAEPIPVKVDPVKVEIGAGTITVRAAPGTTVENTTSKGNMRLSTGTSMLDAMTGVGSPW